MSQPDIPHAWPPRVALRDVFMAACDWRLHLDESVAYALRSDHIPPMAYNRDYHAQGIVRLGSFPNGSIAAEVTGRPGIIGGHKSLFPPFFDLSMDDTATACIAATIQLLLLGVMMNVLPQIDQNVDTFVTPT